MPYLNEGRAALATATSHTEGMSLYGCCDVGNSAAVRFCVAAFDAGKVRGFKPADSIVDQYSTPSVCGACMPVYRVYEHAGNLCSTRSCWYMGRHYQHAAIRGMRGKGRGGPAVSAMVGCTSRTHRAAAARSHPRRCMRYATTTEGDLHT